MAIKDLILLRTLQEDLTSFRHVRHRQNFCENCTQVMQLRGRESPETLALAAGEAAGLT